MRWIVEAVRPSMTTPRRSSSNFYVHEPFTFYFREPNIINVPSCRYLLKGLVGSKLRTFPWNWEILCLFPPLLEYMKWIVKLGLGLLHWPPLHQRSPAGPGSTHPCRGCSCSGRSPAAGSSTGAGKITLKIISKTVHYLAIVNGHPLILTCAINIDVRRVLLHNYYASFAFYFCRQPILLCRRLIFSSSKHLFGIFHLTLKKLTMAYFPGFVT